MIDILVHETLVIRVYAQLSIN